MTYLLARSTYEWIGKSYTPEEVKAAAAAKKKNEEQQTQKEKVELEALKSEVSALEAKSKSNPDDKDTKKAKGVRIIQELGLDKKYGYRVKPLSAVAA